ncbi:MAG: PIG-L family deacetylase, partial [Acidimicrobiia bacterium]|nr:PIG-L family deacetylase [Acidimicrobiia bacterium]
MRLHALCGPFSSPDRPDEFLGHPDGLVEASLVLRRVLASVIRRHRPEVVVSINFRETWGMPSMNHA